MKNLFKLVNSVEFLWLSDLVQKPNSVVKPESAFSCAYANAGLVLNAVKKILPHFQWNEQRKHTMNLMNSDILKCVVLSLVFLSTVVCISDTLKPRLSFHLVQLSTWSLSVRASSCGIIELGDDADDENREEHSKVESKKDNSKCF